MVSKAVLFIDWKSRLTQQMQESYQLLFLLQRKMPGKNTGRWEAGAERQLPNGMWKCGSVKMCKWREKTRTDSIFTFAHLHIAPQAPHLHIAPKAPHCPYCLSNFTVFFCRGLLISTRYNPGARLRRSHSSFCTKPVPVKVR